MKARLWVVLAIVVSVLTSGVGVAVAQEAEPTPTPEAKKINMNIAPLKELETLPGIGQEIAEAIIKGRPYTKVEDLLNIQGIDEKGFAKIRDLIEVKKINVNSATLEELTLLPGITPEIGEAIIKGRPYIQLKDLLNVEGIGEKELTTIREYIEAELAEKEGDDGRGRKSRSRKVSPVVTPIP
jgi:competence ComEA-like helix-hairpin-helix protein